MSVDSETNPYDGALVNLRFVPSEIDLFMFCAATWNTHRIHYDRAFAQASGFRDLVVPGPLQSARLAQMLTDFATAHDGRLATMSVRHHATLYCNEAVELSASFVALAGSAGEPVVEVSVVAMNADGLTATSGRASIVLAATARAETLLSSLRSEVA